MTCHKFCVLCWESCIKLSWRLYQSDLTANNIAPRVVVDLIFWQWLTAVVLGRGSGLVGCDVLPIALDAGAHSSHCRPGTQRTGQAGTTAVTRGWVRPGLAHCYTSKYYWLMAKSIHQNGEIKYQERKSFPWWGKFSLQKVLPRWFWSQKSCGGKQEKHLNDVIVRSPSTVLWRCC